ncbi:hypothetical protein O3M35_008385 [Rhynocoris fuscipes]|uniref:Protein arginine N-methyltransferase domain-containing protein n=1 Tax=Rhynocoris fuscipes TaxID=488301 RepID=A0AAW1D7J2_9HEMI
MTEVEEVAKRSLFLAEKYLNEGKPGRCYAHLLIVLKLKPQWKDKLEKLFINSLNSWDKYLLTEGRYSDLFTCYEQALEHYRHPLLYNNLGSLLYRLNFKKEAGKYFQLATAVNSEYLPALKNLYRFYNESVERWHFRMLNDSNRNKCYRNAILKKIKQGHKTIIDIGTGTGLLSIYAKLEGAEIVYACDYSENMIDIANQVVSSNLNPDSIVIIPKMSNDITIPSDIPYRCSLVVTEVMDAAVFGERILQTLLHAWEKLLPSPSATFPYRVIPHKAMIYIAPVQCLKIARLNQVLGEERNIIRAINFGNIRFIPIKTEPYDTENLRIVEYSCLSDTVEIISVNFNDFSEMELIIDGSKDIENFIINCNREGFIDAIAVWFDLYLDNEIILSSSPKVSHDCCWDQAIFPLVKPKFIQDQSLIKINASFKDGELRIVLIDVPDTDEILTPVPQEIIKFLNCTSLHSIFHETIIKLKESWPLLELCEVLDLSPFPIMGLLLAKYVKVNVTYISEIIHLFSILKSNNITSNFEHILWKKFIESYDSLALKFDIIILNYLLDSGEFNEEIISNLPNIRQCLKPNGIIIPSNVKICCKLVYSEQLLRESQVINPELISEIKVADYINIFKVPYHLDFRINEINYKTLSDFTMGLLNIDALSSEEPTIFEKDLKLNEDGIFNAILCWNELDIYGSCFSTDVHDSYINHTAWLLNQSIEVKKNDLIKIKCIYQQSFLYFSTKKC